MASIVAPLFLGGIGVLFVFLGGWFIKTAILQIKVVQESRNWPPVTGRIVSSKITEEIQKNESSSNSRDPSRFTLYRPNIQYKYEVGGVSYKSNQIAIGDLSNSRDEDKIQKIIEKYPVNSMVQVYYNPADPKVGVLEPGSIGETWRGLVGGLISIGAAYMLIRMGILIFQSR